jgi:HhH-GPD superfamily base excision DNA repair protein
VLSRDRFQLRRAHLIDEIFVISDHTGAPSEEGASHIPVPPAFGARYKALVHRLVEHFGGRAPDPDDLTTLDLQALRELGLSRQKAKTVLDLAQRFIDGRLSEAGLRNLTDEEAIERLTAPVALACAIVAVVIAVATLSHH